MPLYYLSFCDPKLPKGQQFLGATVIEAASPYEIVPIATRLGRNPGGEMARVRAAAKAYSDVLEEELPEGPDKTFVLRNHRSNAMWANVAITRLPDGTPRS